MIKLVYSILGQAATEGASDIHFEPGEDEMRVRFRVDGVLYEAARVPKRMVSGVISRVKIMSELDIAEKRVPQDGRVSVNVDGRKVDLRITTLPTQRGEGATIRILDKEQALRSLDELGMVGDRARALRGRGRAARTAPSWSPGRPARVSRPRSTRRSRSSTRSRRRSSRSRTRSSTGSRAINQINVNRKAGLTFAAGLRSILRADPDIIMVGEIRDAETARIAIESALTGHMVLSTLHTNDAPGTITRLAKMGIESFLTASALDCVVAQRLARKLCTHCKRRTMIPQAALLEAGLPGRRRPRGLRAGRLRALQQHRLQGPDRDLLGDGDERADQGPDRRAAPPRRRSPRPPARRACSTLREDGPDEGPRRRHLDRRARARRVLSAQRPSVRKSRPRPLLGERVAGAVGAPARSQLRSAANSNSQRRRSIARARRRRRARSADLDPAADREVGEQLAGQRTRRRARRRGSDGELGLR